MYSETMDRCNISKEELEIYLEAIEEKIKENEVEVGDIVLVEKGGVKSYRPAVVGELKDDPFIIATERIDRDFEFEPAGGVYIPLLNERYITKNSRKRYEIEHHGLGPSTLVYPDKGHKIKFKDDAVFYAERKYGTTVEAKW